ncbi:rhodanese-like domain-containing protein [Thiocystis violascens]|uniref:Rhodanese-related sulfurtransferase n=1 Tax=Thiocystis violascens (strain ATCC 17096 / DSM 198 / 6111) TaxID=765911 RepID=I3YF75_THIV6|nr:rhodanese-like domain-containing protein [Thiocystis violascens]AFL75643.1 rhodanese-related sulfurtransferase [Thiocystis violascens DSM 198]
MQLKTPLAAAMLIVCFAAASNALAAENKITPTLESVDVIHNGATVTIQRGHDRHATLPEIFQKTDRGCPPFCVEPMLAAPGIETVGELEVLDYLHRINQGESDILIVDSRTPDWVMRGTIPGSVNIPWNKINRDTAGTFETPTESDSFHHILEDEFGVNRNAATGAWNFSNAKTLVLFCNGIWCPQSTANLKTLVGIGYPVHKLKWYRGGMQDWVSVGLTTVTP